MVFFKKSQDSFRGFFESIAWSTYCYDIIPKMLKSS